MSPAAGGGGFGFAAQLYIPMLLALEKYGTSKNEIGNPISGWLCGLICIASFLGGEMPRAE